MNDQPTELGQSSRLRKALVAIVGGLVIMVGIVAIPYPGPGWLIVFAGLGILSQEFPWAKRALQYGKAKYDVWLVWLQRQPGYVKVAFWLLTAVIVVVTIYVLNGYGILNSVLNLNQDWLNSPFVR